LSFQAYLDAIQTRTGKSPAEFRALAANKGFTENGTLKEGVKAGQVTGWLKADFGLGHGHSMALYALFKGIKQEGEA
jgi:hypothetical protein